MEYYLDKLIPLVLLGSVAAFLVYLVRRAVTEKEVARRAEVVSAPAKIEEIVEVPMPEPLTDVVGEIVVSASSVNEVTKPRRKKQRAPTPVKIATSETPIDAVLGMLKKQESLTAAFLLHEVLAPPVSKRK